MHHVAPSVAEPDPCDPPPTLGLTTRLAPGLDRADDLARRQAAILELIACAAPLDAVLEAAAAMVEDHDDGVQVAAVISDGDVLRPRARPDRGPAPGLRTAVADLVLPTAQRLVHRGAHGVPIVVTHATTDPRSQALHPALEAAGMEAMWWASAAPRGGSGSWRGALIGFHPTPGHRPGVHARRAIGVGCTLIAIALERHETSAALAHQALHDVLTGLPNRTLLVDRLQIGLDRVRREGGELAALFVDLDRFKRVNESLGHRAGDAVLTAVADRLRAVTRPGDTIARVGADEFVVVCDTAGTGLATPLAVADRLTEALREPIPLDDGEVSLTASMGLAISTGDTEAASLISHADAAMDRAKARGRNRLEMYDPTMQARAHDQLTLAADLRAAQAQGELRVVYQPIVDLREGTVLGAEALVRWTHPTRGEVPPSVFVPVAEETGTISEIGLWVLETALADVEGSEHAQPGSPFTLCVNLSPCQLGDPDLVTRIQHALDRHGWPADRLCLELTETAMTEDLDLALDVLARLRAVGIRIAVDDFGTGYSSLSHLQRLPIDTIKVDRSFVSALGSDGGADESAMVRCVLGIARTMDLDAVAEGVETPAQLDALRRLGCTMGQGYLFSAPVPVAGLGAVPAG